jgi:HK97 gp10 family phage protein
MSEFEINIQGLNELKRALYAYDAKLGDRVMRKGLRQGASYMAKQIKANAPVKSGRLKKAIKVKTSKIHRPTRNGNLGLYITVSPGKNRQDPKGAWYGKFVETGYNKGSQAITGGQALRRGVVTRQQLDAQRAAQRQGGRSRAGIRYRTGGQAVPGRHFVRNTFNATKDQATRMIVENSETAILELARELGFGVS